MGDMNRLETVKRQPDSGPDAGQGRDLAGLLADVARGDHRAFELVYGQLAGPAYGVARQVLRDPAQSEEVALEALLEIWRTASRFDPAKGSPAAWVRTIAHRRAVDRVRTEVAAAEREQKSIQLAYYGGYSYPQVAQLLGVALGTVKARIRDGLIRMRDCLAVTW